MANLNQVKQVGAALQAAFVTLAGIASDKGHDIKSLTIDVANTNLQTGVINGNFTVRNRSRRAFKLEVQQGGCGAGNVNVTALGVTRRVAA
jgi:hypothetical protein